MSTERTDADAPAGTPLRRALTGGRAVDAAEENAAAEPLLELLCVRIRERGYAFPVGGVREVLNVEAVVPVPHTPGYIRGVFNRHGRVTAILDLSVFVGEGVSDRDRRHLVLEHGELDAAVPVSRVVGSVAVRRSELQRALVTAVAAQGFVDGELVQDQEVYSVVDVAGLLAAASLERRGPA